jgi:hypothetical protein
MSRDEDLHPGNVTVLEAWRAAHPPYGPCSGSHPHIVSCVFAPIERFFSVFRWTLPIYGALHVVPMLLFKRKAVAHAPVPMVLRAGWGSTRSAAFLAAFVSIYQGAVGSVLYSFCAVNASWGLRVDWWQGYFCSAQNAHRALVRRPRIPSWLLAALVSKPSFWLGGLLAGMSVLIEAKHRRGELAMYVLPKGLESAWVAARGKGLVFRTGKHGSALVSSCRSII